MMGILICSKNTPKGRMTPILASGDKVNNSPIKADTEPLNPTTGTTLGGSWSSSIKFAKLPQTTTLNTSQNGLIQRSNLMANSNKKICLLYTSDAADD